METRLFKIITCIFSCFVLIVSAKAQGIVKLTNSDEIIQMAITQIDNDLKPEGSIRKFVEKKEIKGLYDVDLSFDEKGRVVSVFFNEKKAPDLKTVTIFREFLNNYKFKLKTPKGRKYKFNYQFNFN